MREQGVVKWFNELKGFGFINRPAGGDLYVHRSGLGEGVATLRDGDNVDYVVSDGPRGPVASDVLVVPA